MKNKLKKKKIIKFYKKKWKKNFKISKLLDVKNFNFFPN